MGAADGGGVEPTAHDHGSDLEGLGQIRRCGTTSLARIQAVLEYIDDQMIERNDGPVMRGLWAAVTDYLEKVQEGLAAA